MTLGSDGGLGTWLPAGGAEQGVQTRLGSGAARSRMGNGEGVLARGVAQVHRRRSCRGKRGVGEA